MQHPFRRPWYTYVVAVATVAAAIPLRLLLDQEFGVQAPALPFFFAVAVSAWIGGLYPGMVATALSLVAVRFFVPTAIWHRVDGSAIGLLFLMWLGAGAVISLLCETAYRHRLNAQRRTAFLNEALDGIFAWNLDGTIVFWSGGAQRLYGYSASEAVGRSVHELLATRFPRPLSPINALLEQQGSWSGELIYTAKEGRAIQVESRMALLRSQREPPVVVESTRDISERKQAEARLEFVLSTVGDHLVAYDRQWRYTYVNDAAARVIGKTREDLLGRCIWELFPEAVGNQYYREVHQAAEEQRIIRFEHYNQPFDLWYENHVYPSAEGVTVFASDITVRKRAEHEQRDADRRKDEFIAVLAHELRGPLAPLRNGINIVRAASKCEPILSNTVEMMERQMRHLVRLIDDLLDIGRITRGKLTLQRTSVDLADVLDAAAESTRSLIDAQGLKLQIELPHAPLVAQGDRARLVQIFSNLLSNAAKYTDQGGEVSMTLKAEEGEALVEVRDTGIGIPPDALNKVFDMFVQIPEHQERASGGLGIGLALVRNLVMLHGGSVSVVSDGPGKGSTFSIRIPLAQVNMVRESPVSSGYVVEKRRRRVLVVDDSADSAESLAMLLRISGNEVRTAANGVQAVEIAQSYRPEIVFMDLGMPQMDGFEAARIIRSQAWAQGMVLVALTGWGQEVDRRKSQAAGFDRHLVKPVDGAALQAMLAFEKTY